MYDGDRNQMALLPAHTLPELQTAAAYAVFLASYLVFALGKFPGMKIDRPGAAIIGAALLFAFRVVHPAEALRFIDFSTLVLLFSMMLIVGNLHLLGFFEWIAELVIQRLHPRHLLPTVILTSGVLSAFFVNDIICLVLVPFVLTVTRRMRVPALPYLLAVATASNIGSVATITGNPQNMLIGSFSHIGYRDFLFHLGPIAGVGLFIDWAVLHWLYLRAPGADALVVEAVPAPPKMPQMWKTSAVMALVVVGFFAGVPPAMISALGAAVLLIEHTLEPRRLYEQIDWGLLVFFIGLFLIVGGAENAGLTNHLLIFATHWNPTRLQLHGGYCCLVQPSQQCPGGHAPKVPHPGIRRSAHGLADLGHGQHAIRKSHNHRLSCQHHRRRARPARGGYRFPRIFSRRPARHLGDFILRLGVALVGSIAESRRFLQPFDFAPHQNIEVVTAGQGIHR